MTFQPALPRQSFKAVEVVIRPELGLSSIMVGVLLCAALLLQLAQAVNVTVDLGYARYRGKDIGNGVHRWAGMRYARSVSRVDGLRFTAPQEPLEESNKVTTDASKVSIQSQHSLSKLISDSSDHSASAPRAISSLNSAVNGRKTASLSMSSRPRKPPTQATSRSMFSSKEAAST